MSDAIIPLLTLIALEVILGIDNIIFISILADKLPKEKRNKLRTWGLSLAMLIRLALLTVVSWILKLDTVLFTAFDLGFSGKGLILIFGGLFLLYKSTKEILNKTEGDISEDENIRSKTGSFKKLLSEIIILDLVFSVDSIITAVGMVQDLWIMYVAVISALTIMLFASKPISAYIQKHPSLKILAICFLMMIGITLIAEGLHFKIPKGYIYFSMAFAFLVNMVQLTKLKKKH